MTGQHAACGKAEPFSARRSVLVFVVLTAALSCLAGGHILVAGGLSRVHWGWVPVLMWIPGVAALLTRALFREGFHDVGWQVGPVRYWGLAFLGPALLAGICFSVNWLAGVNELQAVPPERLQEAQAESVVGLIARKLPLHVLLGSLAALGEEIGWRGHLYPRWLQAGLPRAGFFTGLIWSVWHLPLILWGDYATSHLPWLSSLLFVATLTPAGIIAAWLRMASGSVWVAMLYHSSHNLFFQWFWELWNRKGALDPFLGGESGLVPALGYWAVVMVGAWFVRSRSGQQE